MRLPLNFRLADGSNLAIESVHTSDRGIYQCVATNIAGSRESKEAHLTVHGKAGVWCLTPLSWGYLLSTFLAVRLSRTPFTRRARLGSLLGCAGMLVCAPLYKPPEPGWALSAPTAPTIHDTVICVKLLACTQPAWK
ncbi:Hemicentin-1 [Frankliniella fusca]|uniref:Hemicentin-1 n=1 Tax=Frankliniella fusca TaxID=407009 RepID=A0AAE1LT60_9NEOP|nr:Hemicentin-1 [Frankliniella fusca]